MLRGILIDLLPVMIFIFGSIFLGYVGQVVRRSLRFKHVVKKSIKSNNKQIHRYIEYRKAM